MELELDEEKRRHQETIKILRKKERNIKEIMISIEEQNQQIALLQEALDKVGHKANLYKRQLQEQVSLDFFICFFKKNNVILKNDSIFYLF